MAAQSTAVATIEHRPRSVLVDMSDRYGMEPAAFEATVRATVCKGNVSREEFAAFLLVAKEHRLNPLLKEVYAFPAKGGGIQPIVSIDGWARIINEHPALDGIEFSDTLNDNGEIVAVECRLYRKDRSRPTCVTEYMAECRRNTDVWRQWPSRMLRHKALIQAARYAFGFSGIVDPDEYERITAAPEKPTVQRLHADFDEPAPTALATPVSEPHTAEAEFSDVREPGEPEAAHGAETEHHEAEASRPAEGAADPGPPDDTPPPQETKPPLPAGMKRGSDLLKEKEAAEDPIDPLEWVVEARRYVDMAEDRATLAGLHKQWTDEGMWDRLLTVSKADHDDLLRHLNAADREFARREGK